ncbi:MAG: hypothetical protein QME62_11790 [Armatimonadota bacterium]|nr:hypothetical protein [Armatimonadota bacterium]
MRKFVLAFILLAMASSVALAQVPGAIWTTDINCSGVDRNIYYDKADVYLNGGPAGKGGPGLPDGMYYYQVTDPSGSVLLSTEPIEDRVVEVVGGRITECKQLYPFDDTPNPGGEYKVWATAVSDYDPLDPTSVFGFVPSKSKTDNFRVKCENGGGIVNFWSLSGYKYYDLDVDGQKDPGEEGIPYWRIALYENSILPENLVGIACTSPGGDGMLPGYYSFVGLAPGTYVVVELMPLGNWVQTGPKESTSDLDPNPLVTLTASKYNDVCVVYNVVIEEGISTNGYVVENVNFGNVCLGWGGGKTLGFWTNKNGQAILQDPAKWSIVANSGALSCPVLAGLPYTSAMAPYLNSPSEIKRFLINANAVNMQYMLAAQWLAIGLNVLVGNVNQNAIIYMGDGTFKTIVEILDAVCAYGASWDRMTQEYFKNALDKANNNMNFVQPTACPVIYPETSPGCPAM